MIRPGSIVTRNGGDRQFRVESVYPHMTLGSHHSSVWCSMRPCGESWVKRVDSNIAELSEVFPDTGKRPA